jgi:methanogenic corrinoid protein MtbC1
MDDFYLEFKKLLDEENREECLKYVISNLDNKKFNLEYLYLHVLKPSLRISECSKDEKICIWKEHVKTSIVRTIIECCYPYVVKQRKTRIKKEYGFDIVILCPDGESHELGARIISDLFEINGLKSLFVGGNTPKEEFINVLNIVKPKYIGISVTNFYNVVAAKEAIIKIREKSVYNVKIIVGGNAFINNPNLYSEIGADFYLDDETKIGDIFK